MQSTVCLTVSAEDSAVIMVMVIILVETVTETMADLTMVGKLCSDLTLFPFRNEREENFERLRSLSCRIMYRRIYVCFVLRMFDETTLESAFMDSTSTLHGLLHETEIAFRMNVREDDRCAYIGV